MSEANIDQLDSFDEIIDVRTPAEFAEDHIPGAINLPVLDNEERVEVGTMYKQDSPFAAKKRGAALVAANIARHLVALADRPGGWRPLVYCWRGGKRSGSMAHVLAEIGWPTGRLQGGYKAYRQHVLADLDTLPLRFRFRVVCGSTGSGKSRLLAALSEAGEQVLDLEGLAAHRGSVLGGLPEQTQPSQKYFESGIWGVLRNFDPSRPVYVEAESKKIGRLVAPQALMDALWRGTCVTLEADVAARVALLMEEYRHFLGDPAGLMAKLGHLRNIHGEERLRHWRELAEAGQFQILVEELLTLHYDPAYRRSCGRHYPQQLEGVFLPVRQGSDTEFRNLTEKLTQF